MLKQLLAQQEKVQKRQDDLDIKIPPIDKEVIQIPCSSNKKQKSTRVPRDLTVGIITNAKKLGGNGYSLRYIHQLVHVVDNLFCLFIAIGN